CLRASVAVISGHYDEGMTVVLTHATGMRPVAAFAVSVGNVHFVTHLDTFMNVHEGVGCAFISPAPRQCSNNF
ncbi:MAG: hypothetical protein RSC66_05120, partial [Comamonas sp.]